MDYIRKLTEGGCGGVEMSPGRDMGYETSLFELFWSFFRLGLTSFGGPAMIAFIRRMAVDRKGWLDGRAFGDGVALTQVIPGASAMQMAAYVGLRKRGLSGAAVAFIGFGLPAFLLMMALSALYSQSHAADAAVSAFSGLQAVIVSIVASAAISFGRVYLRSWRDWSLAASAALLFMLQVSPIYVVVISALAGFMLYGKLAGVPMPNRQAEACQSGITGRAAWWILLPVAGASVLLRYCSPQLFDLASLMFRVDLFAFGGGFASLPLMFHEVVESRGWMDGATFMSGIALGQITPGPIVITSTFVGYQVMGVSGAIAATLGMFLPSFLMMVIVYPYYRRLSQSDVFQTAVLGIFSSFVGLLASVTLRFAMETPWDPARIALAAAALFALVKGTDVLWVVLAAAAISVLLL